MKRLILAGCMLILMVNIVGCSRKDSGENSIGQTEADERAKQAESEVQDTKDRTGSVTEGTEEYRGFLLDNVLHSETEGEIHYNVYIPDSYDGSRQQDAGGALFSNDKEIMGWLFGQ